MDDSGLLISLQLHFHLKKKKMFEIYLVKVNIFDVFCTRKIMKLHHIVIQLK